MTYIDMQMQSGSARSVTWFNNVANGVPVKPPVGDDITNIANMAGVAPGVLCRMIAEEWYDVRAEELSGRAARIVSLFDTLSEDDADIIEHLLVRLSSATEGETA